MTIEHNMKGLLGTKLGMTQLWDENNRVVPVTVIAASTNVVTQVRTPEVDGYNAVQIGYGEIEGRKVNKPSAGHFAKAGLTPRRHLVELRTSAAAEYTVGQELAVDTFAAGEEIDGTGTSKGKGFAGTMSATASPVSLPPTVPPATTASPARSAPAPRRAASSGVSGWPVAWVTTPSPPRTSPCTRSTPRRA